MKKPERPPMIEVRHSPVHGYGVFALRRIRKGTTIMEYLGDRVSHEEADSRYENKDANDNHTFLFTVDAKTVIDGGIGGNDARYINHGCDPNCESASQNKRIFVEAVRTIQPGEELAYDYQIQRDPEDPPNVDEIFACRCGAAKCRGSMLVARKKPRKKKTARILKATRARRAAGAAKSGRGGNSGRGSGSGSGRDRDGTGGRGRKTVRAAAGPEAAEYAWNAKSTGTRKAKTTRNAKSTWKTKNDKNDRDDRDVKNAGSAGSEREGSLKKRVERTSRSPARAAAGRRSRELPNSRRAKARGRGR